MNNIHILLFLVKCFLNSNFGFQASSVDLEHLESKPHRNPSIFALRAAKDLSVLNLFKRCHVLLVACLFSLLFCFLLLCNKSGRHGLEASSAEVSFSSALAAQQLMTFVLAAAACQGPKVAKPLKNDEECYV